MPQLVGKQVGSTGFGLMGLTWREKVAPEEQAFETLRAAIRTGATFWNGGEFYGSPEYNSCVLLERYFAKYPEDADKVVLSIKGAGGPNGAAPSGAPEEIRRSIDACLAQLKGRKKIDIFECARRDSSVPLELTFRTIEQEYVQTGKVGGISLSEVRAETIHEAVKHTKVVAVEVELSLFATDVLDNGVAAACAQYDIPLVAYSPVGRGMLTGQFKTLADIPSLLRGWPRFQPETWEINVQLARQVEELAKKKGCTPAQYAIAWVKTLSKRPGMPTIIPIPGATTAARVEENSQDIELADEDMAEIEDTLAKFPVAGNRYPHYVPTET